MDKTTDGVPVTPGLRVFTNNLDRGTVGSVRHEAHGVRWYDVHLDTDYKGNPVDPSRTVQMDPSRMATRFEGEEA